MIIVLFGVAWIYDVLRERRPEPVAATAPAAGEQIARASVGQQETSRKTFLSAMTLGLGAAIGALVTIPPLVFAGLPPFKKGQGFIDVDVDLGPLGTFPEGQWLITQFDMRPELGDVAAARRTYASTACWRESRALRSSPTAVPTSAARCRPTGRRHRTSSARTSRGRGG